MPVNVPFVVVGTEAGRHEAKRDGLVWIARDILGAEETREALASLRSRGPFPDRGIIKYATLMPTDDGGWLVPDSSERVCLQRRLEPAPKITSSEEEPDPNWGEVSP